MRPHSIILACFLSSTACGGTASLGDGGAGGVAQGGGGAGGSTGGAGGTATGTGGQGGTSTGATETTDPECVSSEECELVDSCCDCLGQPIGAPYECELQECFVTQCSLYNPPPIEQQCRAGRCVTSVDCDATTVFCLLEPPVCPEGQTPSVEDGCWGACIPATECSRVTTCDDCGPGQACVSESAQLGPEYHCVEIPEPCANDVSCECMSESVCVGAFNLCNDNPDGSLDCSCPAC